MSRTVILAACVMCEYHVVVTTLGDFQMSLQLLPQPGFEPSPLGNLCTRSKGLDHWTTSGALHFRDRGRAFLHNIKIKAIQNKYKDHKISTAWNKQTITGAFNVHFPFSILFNPFFVLKGENFFTHLEDHAFSRHYCTNTSHTDTGAPQETYANVYSICKHCPKIGISAYTVHYLSQIFLY